jgi:DegV family protein with EDD domain
MATPRIEIITDSTCDIPASLIQQYGITVLPHTVIWGNEQFRDRVDLQPEAFYRRLAEDPQYPSTAQASILDFARAYQQAEERGAQEIIVLTVSAAMSGTFQSASQAAEQARVPVHIVDSKGPTMSLGWQVLTAARAVAAGIPVKCVLEQIDAVRQRLVQIVCMDTVEYLYKGGRIGNAKRLLSYMLQIKPLVYIDHLTGLVESAATARTHAKAVEILYQEFFSRLKMGKIMHVAVLHGNALQEAEALAERITREFHPAELLINITGPVLGINTGPRALALCGYCED